MSERAMDQDRIDNLEFRKSIHSTFHRLFVALRNGNEADELMADILQQIHIAYAAQDKDLLEIILEMIAPLTEVALADAISTTDAIEKEIRHIRVLHNIIEVNLN